MTFRSKLILGGIAAVVIPFLIAGALTYARVPGALKDLSGQRALQTAIDVSTFLHLMLTRELNLVNAIAGNPDVVRAAKDGDFREIDRKLAETYPDGRAVLGSLFVTDARGVLQADSVHDERRGIDVSDRDYFLRAKGGQVFIGNPTLSRFPGGRLVSVIAAPILDGEGAFRGIVGIALNIDILLGQLNPGKIGETGYVFAVDSEGRTIGHPDARRILETNIRDRRGMEELSRRMLRRETGIASYAENGAEMIAGFAPVELTGWSIAVVQEKREIMAPANAVLVTLLLICASCLAVTIGSIVLLSRRISSPVQKAAETLKQILLHSPEAVISIGPDKRIESVNPAFERLTNRSAEELLGTRPAFRNAGGIPEEKIWRTLDEGGIWTGRLLLSEEGPEPVTLEAMIIPIRDDGKVAGYIEIGRDITRDRAVETRLQQAQKLEAIGTLAGGIAHDFNNVLSGIFGYSDLAHASADAPEKVRAYLREVTKAAHRARDLVKQILTFSRQAKTDMEALAPRPVIEEALKLLRASIPSTIELRANLRSDPPVVANPTQLHQVVVNLCTNAAYAIKDGKGVIEVSLDEADVDADFSALHPGLEPGRHLRLRVADTGCGMTREVLGHIFDPFFSTKPHSEGTGLGLSVVHGIVRSMKGTIAVSTEVGKGTTFDILIPVVGADARETDRKAEEAPLGGAGRILVLDDERQIVEAFSEILAALGYEAVPFTDGASAMEALRKDPGAFDLVITDYTMPKWTGIEIAGKIREIRPDIPVILCSGFVHETMEEAALEAGVRETLRKPVGMRDLAAAVRRALSPGGG